jgi:DNA mismatch repair protein MutL
MMQRRAASYNAPMTALPGTEAATAPRHRPIRELADDALDAGATQVSLRLSAGGMRAFVADGSGCGIGPAGLPPARKRRATRKIGSLHDLEPVAIAMGFCGEGMASVAELGIAGRRPEASLQTWRDARRGEMAPLRPVPRTGAVACARAVH